MVMAAEAVEQMQSPPTHILLQAGVGGLASAAAGYFRKTQDKNKEKKSREKLVEQIQRDELIHFTLKELRRKYITDRVYIIQFHNGGTFYTQASMQKASVTYERCSDGLERKAERNQNHFIT